MLFSASAIPISTGHQEKANVLAFHPQAEGLLASAGYDGKLLLWDLTDQCVAMEMEPLPQPVCCQIAHEKRCNSYVVIQLCSCMLLLGALMVHASPRLLRITS